MLVLAIIQRNLNCLKLKNKHHERLQICDSRIMTGSIRIARNVFVDTKCPFFVQKFNKIAIRFVVNQTYSTAIALQLKIITLKYNTGEILELIQPSNCRGFISFRFQQLLLRCCLSKTAGRQTITDSNYYYSIYQPKKIIDSFLLSIS